LARQKLTDRKIKGKLDPGRHYDHGGSGLHLHVRESGSRAWVQRIRLDGKYVDLGLGNYPSVTLSQAREKARANKALVAEGKDPRHLKVKKAKVLTFAECADAVIAMKAAELSNEKHRAQWASTLETYAKPTLGGMRIDQIEVEHVLKVVQPIWQDKHETAKRVRGRLEAVFDYAIARNLRPAPNPAAWKGNLAALLPSKVNSTKQEHQPALQLADAQRWWKELSNRDGMGSAALHFLTLTACRSGEVRGMTWDEIHPLQSTGGQHVWIIPAKRMKARKEHRVPLTEEMMLLLNGLPKHDSSSLVFHSSKGSPLSDMTLSATMKRMHESATNAGEAGFIDQTSKRPAVPHGLRSTFRNWAAEHGYEHDMAEIQLAHEVGTAVTRAYFRTDMMEKRRKMLEDWSKFLRG
jgi:integrase